MSDLLATGSVRKMKTTLSDTVEYAMIFDDMEVPLNDLLGQHLELTFLDRINCIYCGRKTSKSFNQGYCYPCFKRLAQCDSCIVSPEKCHYHQGTCREPEWGEANCMIDHIVYLANTSGVKVGITRGTQVPTRWIDQGATQAQPIFRVKSRLMSGLVEALFKKHVADKTNWQAMLKGDAQPRELEQERLRLMTVCADDINALTEQFGSDAIGELMNQDVTAIRYPVLEYPTKVKSLNLDKTPTVGGTLLGIKGQYLMFDSGVINIRKYGGYNLSLSRH